MEETLKVQEHPEELIKPKKLNVFGGPYVWAIFKKLDVVGETVSVKGG